MFNRAGKRMALDGLRVVDLSMVYAGPYATKLLADMGAEVVRVESAVRSGRGSAKPPCKSKIPWGVYPQGEPGDRPYNRVAFYNETNRNKYAVTLDLSKPAGVEVFKQLVKVSDVVIENYSPRVMGNFGLDYPALREVNPELVMVSMPAYGRSGPYRDHVAFGTAIEGMAGLSSITGYRDGPPSKPGIAYTDPVGGLFAAFAILCALRHRRCTGKGQHIELALSEVLPQVIGEAMMDYSMNGRIWPRMGNRRPGYVPHGCYRCRGEDQWVTIAIANDDEWQAFCTALGNPPWTEEGKFGTAARRLENQDDLDRSIEEWTKQHDHYDVMRKLQQVGVAAGAVLNVAELITDPHLIKRDFFQPLTHPEAGTQPYPGVSWKLSQTPGSLRMPAPCFGQHNEYVLGELLGMTEGEIKRLYSEGVAAREPAV